MKTPIIIIYVTFGYALNWHKAKLIIFLIKYGTVRIDGTTNVQARVQEFVRGGGGPKSESFIYFAFQFLGGGPGPLAPGHAQIVGNEVTKMSLILRIVSLI